LHATPPVMPLKVPGGHIVQLVAPAPSAIAPMGHAWQSRTDKGAAENVPGRQVRQDEAPGSLYMLAGQHTVAPGREKVPTGQAVHVSDADALENVLAGHGAQEKAALLTAT